MVKKKWPWMLLFFAIAALSIWTVVSQSHSFSLREFLIDLRTIDRRWLCAAVLCMFGFIWFEGLAVAHLIKGLTGRNCYRQSMIYGAADIYFSAITPSATGGQPASGWFMMSDGIPAAMTTVILLENLILYTASLLVCGAAALVLRGNLFWKYPLPSQILITAGAVVLVGLAIAFDLLIRHERIIESLGKFLIGIGEMLHVVREPERLYARLQQSVAHYRRCAGAIKGQERYIAVAFLLNLLQRLSHSLISVFLYLAVDGRTFHALDIWCVQIFTNIGSNTVPIPGAMGVADYLLICGMDLIPDVENPANLELMSRGISFYICVLISVLIIAVGYIGRRKKGEKKSDEE